MTELTIYDNVNFLSMRIDGFNDENWITFVIKNIRTGEEIIYTCIEHEFLPEIISYLQCQYDKYKSKD